MTWADSITVQPSNNTAPSSEEQILQAITDNVVLQTSPSEVPDLHAVHQQPAFNKSNTAPSSVEQDLQVITDNVILQPSPSDPPPSDSRAVLSQITSNRSTGGSSRDPSPERLDTWTSQRKKRRKPEKPKPWT